MSGTWVQENQSLAILMGLVVALVGLFVYAVTSGGVHGRPCSGVVLAKFQGFSEYGKAYDLALQAPGHPLCVKTVTRSAWLSVTVGE